MIRTEPIRALDKIRILECGEPLVDLRIHCPTLLIDPEIGLPFVRFGVGDRLNDAQDKLPPDLRIFVHRGLRTLEMQRKHWDDYRDELAETHPEWPKTILHRQVNRFFAPYDHPAPPGHCTGAAVDVHLADSDGTKLDLTSPFSGWDAAPTWKAGLSELARRNRNMLIAAMLDAGFSSCKDEYWHYSYGDSAWAVRTGRTECRYGLISAE